MNKRTKRQRRRKSSPKHFPIVHRNAAGIDLGSRSHFVAVPDDRAQEPVREFGCYTPELHRMACWLRDCGVETVAMESTGVYWVPVLELLEDYGFEVLLVDARQVKSLSGKKTDVLDCQWIQRLHCYGLLRAAFRPQAMVASMRAYWRQRSGLVKECARHILLMLYRTRVLGHQFDDLAYVRRTVLKTTHEDAPGSTRQGESIPGVPPQ